MTLTFKDQVLARPVPLEHEGEYEIKDIEAMREACKKLDTLPIYYGIRHGDVDRKGTIRDAIGRARNLRVNSSGHVVGDVELDVLPESLAKKGDIGWSTWYVPSNKEGDMITEIMWKHVLATPYPTDKGLKTPLNMGNIRGMRGESHKIGGLASGSAEDKRVTHPTSTHKGDMKLMPDDAPKPAEKPTAPPKQPVEAKPAPKAAAVDPTVEEARREIIEHYREQLKGTITPEALKLMPLKALKAQHNANQKAAKEQAAQAEPEHPAQPRRGLPARPATKEGSTYAGTDISDVYASEHGLTSDQLAEKLHAKFLENFPHTGPIVATGQGEYSNLPPKLSDAQKAKLTREARKSPKP